MAFRNRSADVARFSMVPRADIPRSVFASEHTHKTTFNSGGLIPVYIDEILPGDSCRLDMTAFVRLATPIVPVMDNLHLDSFFFFVPNRILWDNWVYFMGETLPAQPGVSQIHMVPTVTIGSGPGVGSLYDYYGIPVSGQMDAIGTVNISALPFRAYNLIWNEWFRDQNLVTGVDVPTDNGPDNPNIYLIRKRMKRHDYFTSCLPWPQAPAGVGIPQGFAFERASIPVTGLGGADKTPGVQVAANFWETGNPSLQSYAKFKQLWDPAIANQVAMRVDAAGYPDVRVTIESMRQAFQVQRLLERNARGGTRYVELVRSHFGVTSPDARNFRPEYLGGGSSPITVNPIAQTGPTGLTGATTPLGALGGVGTGVAQRHGFSASFTEHGFVIGLVNVRADLTYQQGISRMWQRQFKYDFYWPAFAHLGEQAVFRREIYSRGIPAEDNVIFGYQERWAEYRHKPSRISGLFRGTAAGTLDVWHLSQKFTTPPLLNEVFITEAPPVDRVTAVDPAFGAHEFLFDSLFSVRMTRPIPANSVPGLADHF